MKSSSDVRPAIILPLGNGSYHYNYNIVEEKVEDPETGEKTVYNYDTVQVWQKPDYENLTRAVIRSEIDETEEFSLINDYYAAQLGIETVSVINSLASNKNKRRWRKNIKPR